MPVLAKGRTKTGRLWTYDLAANVVLGAVGVERCTGVVKDEEQFVLIGEETGKQAPENRTALLEVARHHLFGFP
ncbi:hypothetical protein MCP1_780004 [Candidatus Terasakiella magnetica]|nr:hypothetical protein MCP1_780004 [Candidatus Terasakiella magnetica]